METHDAPARHSCGINKWVSLESLKGMMPVLSLVFMLFRQRHIVVSDWLMLLASRCCAATAWVRALQNRSSTHQGMDKPSNMYVNDISPSLSTSEVDQLEHGGHFFAIDGAVERKGIHCMGSAGTTVQQSVRSRSVRHQKRLLIG
jgi:hypothetical protein